MKNGSTRPANPPRQIETGPPTPATPRTPRPAPPSPSTPKGAIVVIDVATRTVACKIEAGCNPVRLALSADGKHAYVTARKDDQLKIFETEDFTEVAHVPVGSSPVPVAVMDHTTVLVGSSNRFTTGATEHEPIMRIDTKTNQVTGKIPAGKFPRDIVKSHGTVYIANFGSNSITVIPWK